MSEMSVFMAKFNVMARIEEAVTGKWPTVCVMGPDEYEMLYLLASDECAIPCEEILRISKTEIEYRGIACFRSGSFNGMVFGSRGL